MMDSSNQMVSLGDGLFGDFSRSSPLRSKDIPGYLGDKGVSITCVWYDKIQKQNVLDETNFMEALGSNQFLVKFLKCQLRKEHPPVLYLVYELCQTKPLEEIVKRTDLSGDDRRKMCLQLALGVKHIHDNGKAHGYLKPRYVFASMDGKNLKIGGYRLRQLIEKSTTATSEAESSIGCWHSPEIYNEKEVDKKSDIFTLGLLFYFILTNGKQPRDDASTFAAKEQNLTEVDNAISTSRPLIGKHLVSIMLRRDPIERPSIEEVLKHPFLMHDNMKQECLGKLSEFLSKMENENPDCVNEELLNLVKSDKQNDRDVLLLLYSHCKVDIDKNIDSPPEIKTMSDIFPALKNHEIAMGNFDPSEIEFEEGHIGKDTGLEELVKSLRFPTSDEQEGSSQSASESGNKITVGEVEVELTPMKKDAWIFYGKRQHSVEKGEVVAKLLTQDDTMKIFEHLKHCHNIVTTKSESRKSPWPSEADTSVFTDPPQPGKEYLWLFMEKCSSKSLLEIAKQESHTLETKRKCIIHILLALHQLIGEDGGKVVHGNITDRKFVLSEDKRRVKLLGSSGWKFGEDADERKKDLISTRTVICALLCDVKYEEMVDKSKDDILKKIEEKFANEKELSIVTDFMEQIWDSESEQSLSHPWLWSAKTRLDYLYEVAECIASRKARFPTVEDIKSVSCPDNWIENMILTEPEREKWYNGKDPNGHMHEKAKKYGSDYKKQGPSVQLLKLIAKKYTSLPSDLGTAAKKYAGEQTLFRGNQKELDFYNFFQTRFPTYFIEVYKLIRQAPPDQKPPFEQNFKNIATGESLPKSLSAAQQ